jgi:hypothetical protein
MNDEPKAGLTVLGRCELRQPCLRLVSDNVRSFEWISLPRREPRRARERLRGLAPWRPKRHQRKPQ